MNIKWDKIRNVLLTISLVAGLIYSVLVTYWLLWPYEPIKINEFILSKNTVSQGERVCFVFKGKKRLPCSANVVLELLNGEAMQVMAYHVDNPVGSILKERCFNVPYHVQPKEYILLWTGSYKVNPLRTIKVVAQTKLTVTENNKLRKLRQ